MAIRIPIVTEFNSKGIQKAVKEFKQLEGAGAKAQFAIKKAAVPAAAALAGIGAALFDATKGAIEDAAAQGVLARQLQRSTKATDAQIAANEEWISTQGKLLGVTDDELRPALAGLVRITKDIGKAQRVTSLAMDIAAAKGTSLGSVTKALEKAYGGNYKAIQMIAPELREMIKEGASLEKVMEVLNKKFGGEAAAAAETTAGKFQRLKVAMDETKESIGEALLPAIEATLPYLQRFGDWAAKNPETFKNVALGISAIAAATLAVNAALAINPYVLIAAGVIGMAIAFDKLATSLEKVSAVGGWAVRIAGAVIGVPGGAAGLINKVLPGGNDNAPTLGTSPGAFRNFDIANPAPAMATTGNRGVVVNINAGVGDPTAIGKEVNNVLDAWARRNR